MIVLLFVIWASWVGLDIIKIHTDVLKGNGYLLDRQDFAVGLYYFLFVNEKKEAP